MSVPMRWETEIVKENPFQLPLQRRQVRRRPASRTVRLVAVWLALGVTVGAGSQKVMAWMAPQAPLQQITASGSAETLASGATTVERRLGFVTVTGSVTNCATKRLSRVEAVVELLDAQKQTLRVDSALVAFDPLPPSEAAPFQVVLNDEPRATSYRVRFKQLGGSGLN